MQTKQLKDLNLLAKKIDLNLFYNVELSRGGIILQGKLTTESILACGKLGLDYEDLPDGWTIFKESGLTINLSV